MTRACHAAPPVFLCHQGLSHRSLERMRGPALGKEQTKGLVQGYALSPCQSGDLDSSCSTPELLELILKLSPLPFRCRFCSTEVVLGFYSQVCFSQSIIPPCPLHSRNLVLIPGELQKNTSSHCATDFHSLCFMIPCLTLIG